MEKILDFLVKISKLKKMPRTGFKLLGVKKPETIAQHSFRVAMLNWLLAKGRKPNLARVIKISLVHDLCEVYAGDMTPYWGLLPKDAKKRRAMLTHYIHLPKDVKEERDTIKFEKERRALEKLTAGLEPDAKKEINTLWLEYERNKSRDGRFVKQGDKVETLFQALEYWGDKPGSPVIGWWEEIENTVDDPILEGFLVDMAKYFYGYEKPSAAVAFLLRIGELKKMPRKGWVIRGVKDPETIIEHAFLCAMATWLLGRRRRLNHEKILKMALAYEICEIYAGDATPYDRLLKKGAGKAVLNRWPRFLKREKERMFLEDYRREKKAILKLTGGLDGGLKRELLGLWDECKRQTTFEGTFVNQVYWLTTYLQALEYYKRDKKFPIFAWYEQMRQYIYDPALIEFLRLEEKRFLPKKLPDTF